MSTKSFLNPKEVLNQIELGEDMTACDFGSGSGGWTIPLAKILKDGRVFAIDVQEEMLSALKSRADLEKVLNIETLKADLEKKIPSLKDNSFDIILMTNLLFQLENRETVFEEAKRILKQGGFLLVVDWKKRISLGPKEGRISPKEVVKISQKFGFQLEKEIEAGQYHYALLFRKV